MRNIGRDPREEDARKLDNLRSSLVPLLAQLSRLQVASGVYDCSSSENMPQETSLQQWDTLADLPAEVSIGTDPRQGDPIRSAVQTDSVPTDTPLPVERQTIGLPSNDNVTSGHAHSELFLRKIQAKTHLNHLRELIAEKSFHYSDLIRGAPRKAVITRARAALKAINQRISFHCQVYSRCRSCLVHLGADHATLNQFCELKKEDIKASTAILTPNESGSTSLKLSWIWNDVAHHILSPMDADVPDNPATMLECNLISLFTEVLALICYQSDVSTGFVPEHR